MKQATIYTDGSCLNNPGTGGYCALIKYPNGKQKIVSGGMSNTTNNRMEMTAIIEGIKALPKGQYTIAIYSDSMITVNGIKEWLRGWVKKNFKKVANVDLWKEYLEVSKEHQVIAHWVKAHNGHPENELCDDIARDEAIKINEKEKTK